MFYRKWAVLVAATLVSCVVTINGCGGDSGIDTSIGGDGGDEGTLDMDAAGDLDGAADGSAGDGTFADTSMSDTGLGDGASDGSTSCGMAAATCATNVDCCSSNCDLSLHVCAAPRCKGAGTSCVAGNECCTFVCNAGGTCGATQCISDKQPCTSDASCCGGACSTPTDGAPRTCTALSNTCETSGNACTTNGQCCSSLCNAGFCSSTPSFCTQTGDVCSIDAECCGGICTKASGATAGSLGLCSLPAAPGGTQCTVTGEVCGAGADAGASDGGIPACGGNCCSRSCAPYGPTGVDICQVPSGCHPTGELCRSDNDCCGSASDPGGKTGQFVTCSKANPTDPVGRCDNGGSCRAAGAICKLNGTSCNAENNCCAGNVNTDPTVCQQDNVGIPRCTSVGNCADAGSKAGLVCSTSADCCGLACVPTNVTDGGAPFVCGASCEPKGAGCTTNADCCPGIPCTLPSGGSMGTCGGTVLSDGGITVTDSGTGGGADGGDAGTICALYGQTCVTGADCCNNVPCSGGRCLSP